MKMFRFTVSQEVGGNLYIKADNIEEAKRLAKGLLDNESAEIELDMALDGSHVIEHSEEIQADMTSNNFADRNLSQLEDLRAHDIKI